MQDSGEWRREKVDVCLYAVIARSKATKQSRVAYVLWIASLTLAMTNEGVFLRRHAPRRRGIQ
jgi:hypothetical protein